ncbi:MAG: hypothetical protein HRU15_00455 [Planctomycetes bacterium]|nr:hypothetical protein [Planctomycetota bacterium]
METHILAIQARCLQWVGLIWIGIGLYLGYDPLFVAWRAALAALLAMILCGALLRFAAANLTTQVADELSEEEMAQAAQGNDKP